VERWWQVEAIAEGLEPSPAGLVTYREVEHLLNQG
jgi:hypothetical protein